MVELWPTFVLRNLALNKIDLLTIASPVSSPVLGVGIAGGLEVAAGGVDQVTGHVSLRILGHLIHDDVRGFDSAGVVLCGDGAHSLVQIGVERSDHDSRPGLLLDVLDGLASLPDYQPRRVVSQQQLHL